MPNSIAMEKKVTVKVCTGTLCYLMGGAELQLLPERIPAEIMNRIDFKGSTCSGFCNSPENGKAPFAEVNGKCIAEATVEKIVTAVREELGGVGYGSK